MSVVIVDNIEGLIEYNPVGPRFSNYMVQAIRDLVSQPLPAVSLQQRKNLKLTINRLAREGVRFHHRVVS